MNCPKRIQRSRRKGWRKPPTAVVVSRPTKWGNPFGVKMTARQKLEYVDYSALRYAYWLINLVNPDELFTNSSNFINDSALLLTIEQQRERWGDDALSHSRAWVRENIGLLKGKTLLCWCPLDRPCHSNVLIWLANYAPPLHSSCGYGLSNGELLDIALGRFNKWIK